MTEKRHIKVHGANRGKTKYFFTEKQMANVVLASLGKSDCPAAKKLVRKLDKKYKLKKR